MIDTKALIPQHTAHGDVVILVNDWCCAFVLEMVGPYNNFRDGQPQWSTVEKCAVLAYSNQKIWESMDCDYPQLFVCSTGCLSSPFHFHAV